MGMAGPGCMEYEVHRSQTSREEALGRVAAKEGWPGGCIDGNGGRGVRGVRDDEDGCASWSAVRERENCREAG